MALCASGEISLGGSTTGRSVNLELGRSATDCIQMNETDVRNLAEVPSGTICMNCFYGKSSAPQAPDTFGQAYGGGYYIGTTAANGTCYYLIVAPNATGCTSCQWRTTSGVSNGTCSFTDGYANTYTGMNSTSHPAGYWTATRTIGGFSDWYLPALNELNTMYVNDGGSTNTALPAGEGFAADEYWSSTEYSYYESYRAYYAYYQRFDASCYSGGLIGIKTSSYSVRAVRREPI